LTVITVSFPLIRMEVKTSPELFMSLTTITELSTDCDWRHNVHFLWSYSQVLAVPDRTKMERF
jgi:hypothetical protein